MTVKYTSKEVGAGSMSKATTKFAIAFAFKELLLEKSIDKITINDITEKCGINRQTFYYHFHDIYELIECIDSRIFRTCIE